MSLPTSTAAFTSTANFIDMEFAQAASVSISRQQQLIWGLNYAYERKEFHLMLPLTNTKSISSADPYCTGSGMGRLAVEMRVSLNCDASISS